VSRIVVLWLHLLGAVVWMGGLVHTGHLVLPRLVRGEVAEATVVRRARPVTWVAVALVLVTGLENLRHARWDSPWLMAKILLLLVLIPLAAHRDFALLPRALGAMEAGVPPRQALSGVRWLDRLVTVGLAAVLLLGVGVARGR
jgi:putative copper export protein